LDLRKFLPSKSTLKEELKFRDEIQGNANVRLLPGTTMACAWPGYFRLCFTAYKKQTVVDAVEGMCKYLYARPSPSS
jgi:aspartate/methionine/tyrosine aminotransferase